MIIKYNIHAYINYHIISQIICVKTVNRKVSLTKYILNCVFWTS